MKKKWYIKMDGRPEGPYTSEELQNDWRISLDTWVCQEGTEEWKRLREVEELAALFKKKRVSKQEEPPILEVGNGGEGVLVGEGSDPGYTRWLIWIIVLLLVWLFYQSL